MCKIKGFTVGCGSCRFDFFDLVLDELGRGLLTSTPLLLIWAAIRFLSMSAGRLEIIIFGPSAVGLIALSLSTMRLANSELAILRKNSCFTLKVPKWKVRLCGSCSFAMSSRMG